VLLKRIAKFAVFVAVLAGVWLYWPWRTIRHKPGVLVPIQPVQRSIVPKPLPEREGWQLTAVAEYQIKGRVLGTKRYYDDAQSDLVPRDLALGWARMSDQAVLDKFELSMGNRFFFYEWENAPAIPRDEIMRSAANNHVISANDSVKKTLNSLVPGHIVSMRGYLVNAKGPGGGTWKSSLRRDDTGNGACELFYVESITAVESLSDDVSEKVAAR
jgi:hypothetical protein